MVLTDYVLGSAIETLGWDPERLWRSLRVAAPPTGTGDRAVSPRGDVAQVGVTMLSLVVGRRLRDDEFPERLEVLVGGARQRTPSVVDAPLSDGLRTWLTRALQLHERSFASVFDARLALEQLLAAETSLIAQPMELDLAMARLERLMPAFELPQPPAASPTPALLDMPAPTYDWALPAVAFDKPPTPKAARPTWARLRMPPPLPSPSGRTRRLRRSRPPPRRRRSRPRRRPPARSSGRPSPPPHRRPRCRWSPRVPNLPPAVAEPDVARAPVARRARPEVASAPTTPQRRPSRNQPTDAPVPWWRSPRAVAAMAALVLLQGGSARRGSTRGRRRGWPATASSSCSRGPRVRR